MEISPVGDRAALDHAPLVEQVAEEAGPDLGRAVAHDAVRARRADHQRRSLRSRAARAEVRAGSVTERREDRRRAGRLVYQWRKQLAVEPELLEQPGVPGTRVQVEQAGARGGRQRRAELPGQPQEEVVAEGHDAPGRRQLLRPLGPQPGELGRPVARVQDAAGAGVNGFGVELLPELLGLDDRAAVLPEQHRSQRPVGGVEQEQAVPEARDPGGIHAASGLGEDGLGGAQQLFGVELGRPVPAQARLVRAASLAVELPAALVVGASAHGRAADVEREHPHEGRTLRCSRMPVVIASNLRKEIAGSLLFEGVSFSVERRNRLALAGPNGAGKTTLLRMLVGESDFTAASSRSRRARGSRCTTSGRRSTAVSRCGSTRSPARAT